MEPDQLQIVLVICHQCGGAFRARMGSIAYQEQLCCQCWSENVRRLEAAKGGSVQ